MENCKEKIIFEFDSWEAYCKFHNHVWTGIDRIQEAMEVVGGRAMIIPLSDISDDPKITRFLVSFDEKTECI